MNQLPPILSHPLVLLLVGALLVFARDLAIGLLRRRERDLLNDKDPANDGQGRLFGSAADALEKFELSKKR